jgi:Sigma-70 region 2
MGRPLLPGTKSRTHYSVDHERLLWSIARQIAANINNEIEAEELMQVGWYGAARYAAAGELKKWCRAIRKAMWNYIKRQRELRIVRAEDAGKAVAVARGGKIF